jgi:type II secretory pathway pseudopilin PulG
MRAYTLIEILVTVALMTSGVAFAAVVGIDGLERAQSHFDLERSLALLRRARSLAQASACAQATCTTPLPEGVRIDSLSATQFEGVSPDTGTIREEITFSGRNPIGPATVLFLPVSGASDADYAIPVEVGGTKYHITVSKVGVIDVTRP